MRRRKDTKAAIVGVYEARAVCVRGATLDSRVASLIGSGKRDGGRRGAMWVCALWCHLASALMMGGHAQFNRTSRLFSRQLPSSHPPPWRVGWEGKRH